MFERKSHEIKEGYNKEVLLEVLRNFDNSGESVNEERNRIKRFEIEHNGKEKEINVKCFSRKNRITEFIYKYFKGSKGKRSYLYGRKLLQLGIKTPEPIAYFDDYYDEIAEEKRTFYISENLEYQLTCREIFGNGNFTHEAKEIIKKDKEKLIKLFTEFTFSLHEKGVEFHDYSPGNVLIKKTNDDSYEFYLIDLNRMTFRKKLGFSRRMRNVSRMMEETQYIEKFSKYYSELYKKNYLRVFFRLYSFVKIHESNVAVKDNTRTFRYFFKRKKR